MNKLLILLLLISEISFSQINLNNKLITRSPLSTSASTININGVINDYTPVLSFDPCRNILTVEDGTKYKSGDTVLLIQMKGAVIDSTNTAAFGTITNYKKCW